MLGRTKEGKKINSTETFLLLRAYLEIKRKKIKVICHQSLKEETKCLC